MNCIQQSWKERIVGACKPLSGETNPFRYTGLKGRNIGILCKLYTHEHTHTQRNLSSLIYAQKHSHNTTFDIGGPLQKHVSWSDLWLFYRAVLADCSDAGLIHQCQHTLSHTRSRHANKHYHTYSWTHIHKTDSIALISVELFWLSACPIPGRSEVRVRWLKFILSIPDWACLFVSLYFHYSWS